MSTRTINLLPINLILLFNITTFLLFLSNTLIDYPINNNFTLSLFVIINNILIYIGFIFGIKIKSKSIKLRNINFTLIMFIGFFAYIAIFYPILKHYTGNIDFVSAFTDPLSAYKAMASSISGDRSERIGIILTKTLLSPFIIVSIPLFLYFSLSYSKYKIYTFIITTLFISMSVFRGTDKELFDIFIIFIAILLLHRGRKNFWDKNKFHLLSFKRILFIGVAITIILGLFSYKKSERLGTVTQYCFPNTDICHPLDFNGNISMVSVGIYMFYRYLTQGYYGLSIAMDADYDGGYGFGHSRPLQYLASKLGDIDFSSNIINQLDDSGWSSTGVWSTGYSWIANDVPFTLIPFLLMFFSFIMGFAYKQVILRECKFSIFIFTYLFFSFIYMPANLQLAQSGDFYFGFLFWFSLYIILIICSSIKEKFKG